jgi:hypothetical protein
MTGAMKVLFKGGADTPSQKKEAVGMQEHILPP